MAVQIKRELIEHTLLGTSDSRRLVQDSPILVDVWAKYAHDPGPPADLLITSHKNSTANKLAAAIYHQLKRPPPDVKDPKAADPEVAPMQGFVAARLYFGEVLTILVPLTEWWQNPKTQHELQQYNSAESPKLEQTVDEVVELVAKWPQSAAEAAAANNRSAFGRFLALCTLVCLAGVAAHMEARKKGKALDLMKERATKSQLKTDVLALLQEMQAGTERMDPMGPMVHRISLNRTAAAATAQSVPTVKGDAARRVFEMDFSGINWAVVDSGIDSGHPAFGGGVKETYDFTNYRQIVSLGNDTEAVRNANLKILEKARDAKLPRGAGTKLRKIAEVLNEGRPVPWDLVNELVQLENPRPPTSPHGTHVAGIIGASKTDHEDSANGMCPGVGLYDFRILTPNSAQKSKTEAQQDTEFAIIAALQFIRYLNEQAGYLLIAGVNLSLQIAHDVKSFACGRTPICNESERLIDSGVVVVAAAGNFGEEKKLLVDQPFIDYQPYSITDPGNAERVITVGATHRLEPFNFGISFFSCRGPTGDGRLKPDIVAPGECITAPLPSPDEDENWGQMDGTSMAAPHVSGAAAMLMARYPELIGKPDRIKRILCETATDLGRQRNFQGHGLLDVLRALQSQ